MLCYNSEVPMVATYASCPIKLITNSCHRLIANDKINGNGKVLTNAYGPSEWD